MVWFSTTTNVLEDEITGDSSSTSETLIVTIWEELFPAKSVAVTVTTAVV